MKNDQTMMRVRGGTKRLLEKVAQRKGWKTAEAAERAALLLADQEGHDDATATSRDRQTA